MRLESVLLLLVQIMFRKTVDGAVVRIFDDATFYKGMKRHRLTLVAFYAPWCDHCMHLMPQLDLAAKMLDNEHPSISIAKVDATENDLLAAYEHIESYPTLKLYNRGNFQETYTGSWDASGIVKFLRWYNRPALRTLSSKDMVRDFIRSATDTVVLGAFITEMDGGFKKLAEDLAAEYRFAHCAVDDLPLSELELRDEPDEDMVYVVKASTYACAMERPLVAKRSFASEKVLKEFIFRNNLPLVGEVNDLTRSRYYDMKSEPLVVVHFDTSMSTKRTRYVANRLRRLAADYRSDRRDGGERSSGSKGTKRSRDVRFGYSNLEELDDRRDEVAVEFLVTVHFGSDFRMLFDGAARDVSDRSYGMDMTALRTWLDEVALPDVDAYERSMEVKAITKSSEWLQKLRLDDATTKRSSVHEASSNVLDLDAESFRSVVYHPEAHVFVAVYASWCPYCRDLNKTLDALSVGALAAHDDIVIARVDGSRYAVPPEFDVGSFPSFFFCKRTSLKKSSSKWKKRRKKKKGPATEKFPPPERFNGLPLLSEIEKFVANKAGLGKDWKAASNK